MVEVSAMVMTAVLASISMPGWIISPMTVPSMGATALQLSRFFWAVSRVLRASSRLCWTVKISLSLSSPSMRTSTWPAATCR